MRSGSVVSILWLLPCAFGSSSGGGDELFGSASQGTVTSETGGETGGSATGGPGSADASDGTTAVDDSGDDGPLLDVAAGESGGPACVDGNCGCDAVDILFV